MEIWKRITGFKNYEVSNMGNVRLNYIKEYTHKNVHIIKNLKKYNHEYQTVYLCLKSKVKLFRIHRLVAREFCDNYKENYVVNHIDGNKLNNKASNLEWCSRSYNSKHAYDIGLMKVYSKKPHINFDTPNLLNDEIKNDINLLKTLILKYKLFTISEYANNYNLSYNGVLFLIKKNKLNIIKISKITYILDMNFISNRQSDILLHVNN